MIRTIGHHARGSGLAVAAVSLLCLQASPAPAQDILTQPSATAPPSTPPEPGKFAAPPCDGDIAVLRLIEIKPKGTMAGYLTAVAKNLAWFRAHGYKQDDLAVAKVMVEDRATHQLTYAQDRVFSIHMRPPFMGGRGGHDSAWDEFHDLYQTHSNILTEYNLCIPSTP